MRNDRPRIGVALGGGAARGLAHLGVLETLAEADLAADVVAGTSFGALAGGLYAVAGDAREAEAAMRRFIASPEFARMRLRLLSERERPSEAGLFWSLSRLIKQGIFIGYSATRPSFVPAEQFARHIAALLPDVDIARLRVPLAVVAADLDAGSEVVLTRGPLRPAVSGSCALPGVLPPVEHLGRRLIDGGCVNKVPVGPARALGADLVIAVDVAAELADTRELSSGLNILTRSNAIASARLKELLLGHADVVLRPDVGRLHWADFSRLDEALEAGREAARRAVPEIRARLERVAARRLAAVR